MMNKNKSAKMHLLRFLFLLPVLALILVSFRKEIGDTLTGKQKGLQQLPVATSDTVPTVKEPNKKGYIINVIGVGGDCTVVIKDKKGNEVKRVLLTEWNENEEKFEANYGKIPPPPPPAPPVPADALTLSEIPAPPAPADALTLSEIPAPPTAPTPPAPIKLPANVRSMSIQNTKAVVTLKNGEIENYDLSKPAEKEKFGKKYGDAVPVVPGTPATPATIRITPATEAGNPAPAASGVRISLKGEASFEAAPANADGNYFKAKGISGDPLIVLDGEFISQSAMQAINPENIQSVSIFKGEKAMAAYGDKAQDGVIVIISKGAALITKNVNTVTADRLQLRNDNDVTVSSAQIELNNLKSLVLLDGKELPPNSGKLRGTFNIVTLKKEEAIKKYGDKGKDGATEITTLK